MPWSVVQTHPGAARGNVSSDAEVHELPIALRNLRRQGFEYYNPVEVRRIVVRGKMAVRKFQLFENYLFVKVVDRWRALSSTIGIAQLIMAGPEQPAVVSDEVIERFRAKEVDGIVMLPKSKFYRGQKVQVVKGPFSWERGLYDGQSSRDRAFVLLSMLGSRRRVELSEGNLVAA